MSAIGCTPENNCHNGAHRKAQQRDEVSQSPERSKMARNIRQDSQTILDTSKDDSSEFLSQDEDENEASDENSEQWDKAMFTLKVFVGTLIIYGFIIYSLSEPPYPDKCPFTD